MGLKTYRLLEDRGRKGVHTGEEDTCPKRAVSNKTRMLQDWG